MAESDGFDLLDGGRHANRRAGDDRPVRHSNRTCPTGGTARRPITREARPPATPQAKPAPAIPLPVPVPVEAPVHVPVPVKYAASPAGEPTYLWLRHSDQVFVGVLVCIALGLMIWHWGQMSGWGRQSVEIRRLPEIEYAYRLDVNRATWVEWALLDGIGEILARRIVADRDERGPFRSIDDVLRVKGIGPKKLAQMRPWLEIGAGDSQRSARDVRRNTQRRKR